MLKLNEPVPVIENTLSDLNIKKKKYKGNKSHKSNESSENTFLNNKKKLKYNDKYYINIFIYF